MNRFCRMSLLLALAHGWVQAQIVPPPARLYEMATDGSSVAFEDLTAQAEAGNAEAELNLGWLYHDGWVVPQDSVFAVQLFAKAAEQGLADAQFWLGWMYDIGEGVRRDSSVAFMWYRKAADQGDGDAQHNLGIKYRDGAGVSKDPVAAYLWLSLAATQGERFAEKSRNDLQSTMTPAQLAEAQRLVAEWKPRK
jgi:TPR repeat protein